MPWHHFCHAAALSYLRSVYFMCNSVARCVLCVCFERITATDRFTFNRYREFAARTPPRISCMLGSCLCIDANLPCCKWQREQGEGGAQSNNGRKLWGPCRQQQKKKNHIRNSPLCSFLLFSTLARSLSLLLLCDALHTAITINFAWTVYVRVCKCASVRYFYNVSRIKCNGDFLFRVFPTFQTATAAALLFVFHISISISASLRFGCLLLLWHNSFAR